MLHVVVLDAQGGGLGAAVVKKLVGQFGAAIRLTAAGANAVAASAMKKSGAALCVSGENAVCEAVRVADVVIGGIGIIAAGGILGEITPRMACAVAQSDAKKILIPMSRCRIIIPGAKEHSAGALIDLAVAELASLL